MLYKYASFQVIIFLADSSEWDYQLVKHEQVEVLIICKLQQNTVE